MEEEEFPNKFEGHREVRDCNQRAVGRRDVTEFGWWEESLVPQGPQGLFHLISRDMAGPWRAET